MNGIKQLGRYLAETSGNKTLWPYFLLSLHGLCSNTGSITCLTRRRQTICLSCICANSPYPGPAVSFPDTNYLGRLEYIHCLLLPRSSLIEHAAHRPLHHFPLPPCVPNHTLHQGHTYKHNVGSQINEGLGSEGLSPTSSALSRRLSVRFRSSHGSA